MIGDNYHLTWKMGDEVIGEADIGWLEYYAIGRNIELFAAFLYTSALVALVALLGFDTSIGFNLGFMLVVAVWMVDMFMYCRHRKYCLMWKFEKAVGLLYVTAKGLNRPGDVPCPTN
jgi:hypothetical protein